MAPAIASPPPAEPARLSRVGARFPTTFRIAALAVLLALSSNLLLIGFLYLNTRDAGQKALRERIAEEARALSAISPDTALDKAIRDALGSGDPHLIAERFARDGSPHAGNVAEQLPPVAMQIGPALQVGKLRLLGEEQPVEAGYVVHGLGADGWLLSGRALGEGYALQQTIERSLLLGLVLALALGLACGMLIARDVGRRVAALAAGVDRVGGGGALDIRLPVSGAGDAFDRLTVRINEMLDRIERLMGELRMLTDSLAHDLRSPLSRLRARIERAMTAVDEGHRDQLLSGVMNEVDALMRIIGTVLEIGRSEAGAGRDQFETLKPSDLVGELGEMFEPFAEDAGIALELTIEPGLPPIYGHQQLLAQALSNLVDNAIKHGASGATMQLFARGDGSDICLGVADHGPGIAPADRQAARRRFGRLDASRSVAGAGLGLTLVDAIAHLHDGRLELADNRPGLLAQLRLPLRKMPVAALDSAARAA